MTTATSDVLIVGAGLAGLCCARHALAHGLSCQILEASDAVGGRVRTDHVNGFQLDRGFQVLLTAYPETQRVLDYTSLKLHPFYPGALVYYNRQFHRVADPWRRPLDAIGGLFTPIGTLSDKLRIARVRHRARTGSLSELFYRPEQTTLEMLKNAGFSAAMIERFFRPFFGGIFLEPDLHTSSRMFEFVFRMFSSGDTALPADGMGAIPHQLLAQLPPETVRLHTRVHSVHAGGVSLPSGETIEARAVVVATDGPEAARLLPVLEPPPSRPVTCLYFAAETAPITEPILVLNGDGQGPVNNLCVPSALTPTYAPPDAALISATVLEDAGRDDAALDDAVRTQLQGWFGDVVQRWQLLRTYRIAHALPEQIPPAGTVSQRPVRLETGLFVCGDHRDSASIHGAMVSGRRAAEAIIVDFATGHRPRA